ncbi:MAG TPA: class I SAM-dependent methyltransferase [Polyangiaceae bacterium]|jgi:SAM-dependent methyltransferase
MFQRQVSPGYTPAYWDAAWDAATRDVAYEDAFCEETPLHAILSDKLRPDRIFLEGGCGPGQWVKYFHRRGYQVVGVDFAPRAVERLRRELPEADVRLGDIMRLPFSNGEVHAYYSGGVVEHDESGPEVGLREARRVLADDGWFLCSVPDASALRNVLFAKRRTVRRDMDPEMVVTRVDHTRPEEPPAGMHFFQYVFTVDEFSQRLADAGFEVAEHFGYSLIWGLMEVPGVTPLTRRLLRRSSVQAPAPTTATRASPAKPRRGTGKEILRRALLREDRTLPLLGPAVAWATEHMSNMRMYLARPR